MSVAKTAQHKLQEEAEHLIQNHRAYISVCNLALQAETTKMHLRQKPRSISVVIGDG
jgi:hypothetical protein